MDPASAATRPCSSTSTRASSSCSAPTFNAQDTWLLFFLLTGVGFGLVYATALAGRVWCGWACPQTVFLEGVYRRIERSSRGRARSGIRRNAGRGRWTRSRARSPTHALYSSRRSSSPTSSSATSCRCRRRFAMVRQSPARAPGGVRLGVAMTAALLRQLRVVPRAALRRHLPVRAAAVGAARRALARRRLRRRAGRAARQEGRRRAPATASTASAASSSARRASTSATASQMECLACTACIDACDDVMDQARRDRAASSATTRRTVWPASRASIVRPRIVLYTVLLVVGAVVAFVATRKRTDFEVDAAAPARASRTRSRRARSATRSSCTSSTSAPSARRTASRSSRPTG